MPAFDLQGIRIAKYNNENGAISYGTPMSAGDAMTANLELKFAEGRLYAESSLAEYIKEATGGTISLGVKYVPANAQKVMYGFTEKTRTVGETAVTSLLSSAKSGANYVGVFFYAPDMIDGERKMTAVFVHRALFAPPSMSYQTKGENITFTTPTTTGEFLADNTTDRAMFEIAVCDDEATAIAWGNKLFTEAE